MNLNPPPAVAMYGPVNVKDKLTPGQTKLWCACGLSKKQPWCDGNWLKVAETVEIVSNSTKGLALTKHCQNFLCLNVGQEKKMCFLSYTSNFDVTNRFVYISIKKYMGALDSNTKNDLTTSEISIAGATSGVIARIVGQPLDVLKIRFQIQDSKGGLLKYVGVWSSVKKIVKEESIFALWKGHVPAQILSIIYGTVQFTTFEQVHRCFHTVLHDDSRYNYMNAGIDFTCGGIAGMSSTLVCQPFDVIRTRLVAQTGHQVYKNIFNAASLMWHENGIRTFYKGLFPTLLMIVPNVGLQFAFYGTFKQIWISIQADRNEKMMRLCCGAVSGLCSKLILLPFDVVKKGLQVAGLKGYERQYSGIKTLIKKEGAMVLYRGAVPSVIKASVVTGVTFFTYEQTCDLLRRYR